MVTTYDPFFDHFPPEAQRNHLILYLEHEPISDSQLVSLDSCFFPPSTRTPSCLFTSPQLQSSTPQTHQSVGHATKDDKGPEGVKPRNWDSWEKRNERGSLENPSFFTRTVSLLSQPLGSLRLLTDWETDGPKTDESMKGWTNERCDGDDKPYTEEEEAPGSLSARTSVRIIRVHLSIIYIYINIY